MWFVEQQRENDRALRKAGRDIERERRKLEDEEKKIVIITSFQNLILLIDFYDCSKQKGNGNQKSS